MTTPPTYDFSDLRDAHLHLLNHGKALAAVQLADCSTVTEVLDRVGEAHRTLPAHSAKSPVWIDARGLRTEGLAERRYPTIAELDAVTPGRPAVLKSFDYHALMGNTPALLEAGIETSTIDPPAGVIVRDEAGTPTGVLLEAACNAMYDAQPVDTSAQRAEQLALAVEDLRRRGFTEVHDMKASPQLAELLLEMDDRGELDGFAIQMYAVPDEFERVQKVMRFGMREDTNNPVRFAGLKLFIDGTLNSRTAWMLQPFADPIPAHPTGIPNYTPEQIEMYMRRAHHERFDIAAHAIGDGAVRALLDAYEAVEKQFGEEPGFTLRIEHAQFIDEADIPRFARPGKKRPVIASLQPCHLLTDMEAIERLVPGRAGRAFPLKDLIDAAASAGRDPADMIYLGSDSPIVPANPADNLQAAIHRRRSGMDADRAIAPEQAITREAALGLHRSRIGRSGACEV
ncbi:MAG: amidohydrolase [Phycisphaerales bacterium JB050]